MVLQNQQYKIEMAAPNTPIAPGTPTQVRYKITDTSGEVARKFEAVHERIMHCIVVRDDLAHFQHLHPDFNEATGEFSVVVNFPTDGLYHVIADFTLAPTDGTSEKLPVVISSGLTVGDVKQYHPQPVVVDSLRQKHIGDYVITFTFPGEGHSQRTLDYTLTVTQGGQPVTDLENYLGALGHSVILKEGTLDFIHTHPKEHHTSGSGEHMPHGHEMHHMGVSAGGGPEIPFSAHLPDAGVYKIFTQFQHKGRVVTVEYAISVN
jgi:hypothetical protein